MTTDLRTSILVNRQVPEFVRDEYPLFVTFLEAYYEFLEQKQGTKINDLITQAKNLRHVSDVDDSIEQFEKNFINNYRPPRTSLTLDHRILLTSYNKALVSCPSLY